jgi:hypothetical protein
MRESIPPQDFGTGLTTTHTLHCKNNVGIGGIVPGVMQHGICIGVFVTYK